MKKKKEVVCETQN